jgi:hypothetical protein
MAKSCGKQRFPMPIREAKKLVNKEVLFEAKIRSSAFGERRQLVFGKVVDVEKSKKGKILLKLVSYRRTTQATTDNSIPTNLYGQAIRTYPVDSITNFFGALNHRGVINKRVKI